MVNYSDMYVILQTKKKRWQLSHSYTVLKELFSKPITQRGNVQYLRVQTSHTLLDVWVCVDVKSSIYESKQVAHF